jgi:CO/xanthine dehydrogenase FAD-binding subunit
LLVWRRAGRIDPAILVSLQDIGELKGIVQEGTTLRIGSMETCAGLLRSDRILEQAPALHGAMRVLGSPLVRASATLGGNLVTASPGGDSLPPLVAYGAEVELLSARGMRRMPLDAFLRGPGQTELQPGEILRAVMITDGPRFHLHHFEKVGRRNAMACALASLAALVRKDEAGRVLEARLAWGSVAPTVLRCPEAEQALLGTWLSPEALRRAGELACSRAQPVADLRASAGYRRKLVGNLLQRVAESGCAVAPAWSQSNDES